MTVHKITLYKMTHTLTNICQSTVINNEKKIPHSRSNKSNVKKNSNEKTINQIYEQSTEL